MAPVFPCGATVYAARPFQINHTTTTTVKLFIFPGDKEGSSSMPHKDLETEGRRVAVTYTDRTRP